MAWVAAAYDRVSIGFTDATPQTKYSDIRVLSGASETLIQNMIAAEQAESNASCGIYTRHTTYKDSAAVAAVPYDSSVNPNNLLSTALELDFSCGPNNQATRTSILAPSNVDLIKGNRDKSILDPTSTGFANLQTAGVAVMVNTGGLAAVGLQRTQIETRKSRGLV